MTSIFEFGLYFVILFLIYGLYKYGQRIRRLEKETQKLRKVISSGSFDEPGESFKAERQWALSFHREERRFTAYHSDSEVEQNKQTSSLFYIPAEIENKTFWPASLKARRRLFAIAGLVTFFLVLIYFAVRFLQIEPASGFLFTFFCLILAGTTFGAGRYLSKQHKIYGEIIFGAGIGILYLVFFLAAAVYGLISGISALLVLFLIALFGGYFSFISNSKILVTWTIFGGILTLLFLSAFGIIGISTFFNYLIILNAGILSLSLVKGWYDVSFGTFIATVLAYLVVLASTSESVLLNLPFFHYALAGFLLFFSFSLLYGIGRSEKNGLILALFALNPAFFLFIVIQDQVLGGSGWSGFLSLCLSALYLVVYFILPKKSEYEAMFRKFSLGISSAFFVFFVPIQFEVFYITVGWALQATLLFLLARLLQSKFMDFLAKLLFVLVFLRLVVVDSFFLDPTSLIFNLRFGLFVAVVLFLVFSYAISLRLNKNESSGSKNFLLVQIYFLGLWSVSLEVLNFLPNFFLPFVWLLWALLLGVISLYLHNFWLRAISYVIFVFSGTWILLTQSFLNPPATDLILNSRAFSFLSLIILSAVFLFFLSKSSKKRIQKEYRFVREIFFIVSALLLFWLVTRETIESFTYQLIDGKSFESRIVADSLIKESLVLSSVWMAHALILLSVGFFKKVRYLPVCAVAIFVLVVGKTFVFDATNIDYVYRLISFLVLGGVLFLVGCVYIFFSGRLSKVLSGRKSRFLNLGRH